MRNFIITHELLIIFATVAIVLIIFAYIVYNLSNNATKETPLLSFTPNNLTSTFWYSSGSGFWTQFSPEIDTSGEINWVSSDLAWTTWTYDGIDQYWIKIIRTHR